MTSRKAPPISISGPSRPIDNPPPTAIHDDATRDAVERSDNRTRPSAIAAMTLLTPCVRELQKRAMLPAKAAVVIGAMRRPHRGSLATESTMLSAPYSV